MSVSALGQKQKSENFETQRFGQPAKVVNPSGSLRSRFPVAAATALPTAGATGGRPGSPIPLG
jgi:hypothetical protein